MNLKGFPAAGALPLGKMLRRTAGTGLLPGLILVGIARAHHGFDGRYNLATPVWVEGLVVEAYFGNPHSELTVEISSDLSMPAPLPDLGPAASFLDAQSLTVPEDVVGQTVVLELPPTAQYSSLGDRIARGDRIAAVAVRNCDPPRQLNVQWLQLPGGEVESRTVAMSYMVEEC
ncbi:hypothetical protein CN151_33395 [Sinorhizobium meliloti]|uniref:hypothetical protein n=1 Tax=Rhizobium meliloti TaxID=382 RepID=UPI0002A57CDC|nr:hypothetical protein [Sinorhizobium meliloti]AGA10741.1 hypothetical protein C770_GR4pD0625 [Sinorhizobium meliloti GR4]RVK91482.1 hypothetical protein CN151_33395 [Sinorhizobium meliloti]RVM87377.1 hypothetical protein CN119_28725 [Sinorhizobium meliloti]RVN13753.1 hypothetical protein CN112_04100 [Sinorhizobium meliloti]